MKEVDAPSHFTVDTKILGFEAGTLTKDAIFKSAKRSLDDLGVHSVYILPGGRLRVAVGLTLIFL